MYPGKVIRGELYHFVFAKGIRVFIEIENIDGETFSGIVISSPGVPQVEARIDEIDHIAKEKATMHKA